MGGQMLAAGGQLQEAEKLLRKLLHIVLIDKVPSSPNRQVEGGMLSPLLRLLLCRAQPPSPVQRRRTGWRGVCKPRGSWGRLGS